MESVWAGLAWVSHISAWVVLIWIIVGTVFGGVLVACDEWRFHRNRPKPEIIRGYADELEAAHGDEALKLNGDAMYDARLAKNFDRYRFLKEVSAELIARLVSRSATSD